MCFGVPSVADGVIPDGDFGTFATSSVRIQNRLYPALLDVILSDGSLGKIQLDNCYYFLTDEIIFYVSSSTPNKSYSNHGSLTNFIISVPKEFEYDGNMYVLSDYSSIRFFCGSSYATTSDSAFTMNVTEYADRYNFIFSGSNSVTYSGYWFKLFDLFIFNRFSSTVLLDNDTGVSALYRVDPVTPFNNNVLSVFSSVISNILVAVKNFFLSPGIAVMLFIMPISGLTLGYFLKVNKRRRRSRRRYY